MNDNPRKPPPSFSPVPIDRGLTIHKTAEILGYSYSAVYRMIKSGDLQAYGARKKIRVYESSIHRYRQGTHNTLGQMPKIRDKVRTTGPRHRQAMTDLERLLK